ncbi:hypothetical protein EIP91_011498 [Steccherinum ochraceum]|uniref:Uncharacterized protein n=1 Tax=Steccherinum ochraceum TaxID=92696 RepID=A0A4R0RM85_9APHY|nr:hypothetical protein EIP91_011498 [Steccherinum ochraceum]
MPPSTTALFQANQLHARGPNFPIDKAYLIGDWMAATFWGAFTVLFITCMLTSLSTARRRWFSLLTVFVMYCLATAHIGLALTRLIEAFIIHAHDPSSGADTGAILYLANIAIPINRSKDMIYITTIWMGDSILVWRCYMVWNKDWRVIALPCLMVVATAVSGYGAVGEYFNPHLSPQFATNWASGMLAVSMVTNIILTMLTSGRIWMLTRSVDFDLAPGAAYRTRYRVVILTVLEAGLIVAIAKFLEFLFFELAPVNGLDGFNALYIMMECMPQIMGIAPTFIILAVSLGFTSTGSEAYSVNSAWRAHLSTHMGSSSGPASAGAEKHSFVRPSRGSLGVVTTVMHTQISHSRSSDLAILSVSASLYPTYPLAKTVWKGGRVECVTWVDNGAPPKLEDMGRVDVELYVNGHTHVATLAKNVNPESKYHQFKVLPSWGPDDHNYHVRFVSQHPPSTVYTADFTIEDMHYNSTAAYSHAIAEEGKHAATATAAATNGNTEQKLTSTTSVSLYTPVMTLVLPDTTIVSTLAPTTPKPTLSKGPSQGIAAAAATPMPTTPSIVIQPDPNADGEKVHGGTISSSKKTSNASATTRRVDMEKLKFRVVFILWPVLIGLSMAL